MSRTTIRSFPGVLGVLALLLATSTAQAGALNLAVDSSQSSLQLSVNVLNGLLNLPFGTVTLSGAAPGIPAVLPPASPATTGFLGDVVNNAGVPGTLSSYGGGAFGTNLSLSTGNIPFVGSFTIALNVPGFALDTGTFSPLSAIPGNATYNVSGLGFDITAGQLTYSGSGLLLGALGSNTINFGINFFNSNVGGSQIAQLTLGAGPPSNQPATLRIPINTTANLLPGVLGIGMTGQLVLTGVKVPEPGTWALLVVGTCCLIPAVRRRRRM